MTFKKYGLICLVLILAIGLSAASKGECLSMKPIGQAGEPIPISQSQSRMAEKIWPVLQECLDSGFSSMHCFQSEEEAQEIFDGWRQIDLYLQEKQLATFGQIYLVYSGRRIEEESRTVYFYYQPLREQESVNSFVQQTIHEIGLNGKWTQQEAADAIIRYVADYYDYDIETEDLTLAESLEKKKGVCRHYAMFAQAICKAVGMNCAYVGGYTDPDGTGGHAWNYIEIDHKWFWADPCWQDGRQDERYMPSVEQFERHYANNFYY